VIWRQAIWFRSTSGTSRLITDCGLPDVSSQSLADVAINARDVRSLAMWRPAVMPAPLLDGERRYLGAYSNSI